LARRRREDTSNNSVFELVAAGAGGWEAGARLPLGRVGLDEAGISRCKGSPAQLNAASRSPTSKKPRCVLAQDGEWLCTGLNVAGSVVLCLLAVWLGYLAGAVVNL
jgi:hypothetical protein